MQIYLTSDNIYTKTNDEQFLKDIKDGLEVFGHTVTVFLPIGPNSHFTVMEAAPANSLIVNIYGGACAGTLYEMGLQWFKNTLGTRKCMVIFASKSATVITDLAWLPRAWDDDFSPSSFTGLENPDDYLINNGYTYAYAYTVAEVVSAIIKQYGGSKVVDTDVSKSGGAVPLAVFQDMIKRFDAYVLNNGKEPSIVYLKSGGGDYVPIAVYKDMKIRYDVYRTSKNIYPSLVYYVAPTPVRTVGPIQAQLESFLGQFDSFTAFYNKCLGRGYSYYYNDVKTLQQEIDALRNKSGLNCSDVSQLAAALATEMGYQWRYVHVQCQSGGHIRGQILGKEFSSWTRIDMAACISVGSQYPIGQVWCDYTNAHIETTNWILVDDGV